MPCDSHVSDIFSFTVRYIYGVVVIGYTLSLHPSILYSYRGGWNVDIIITRIKVLVVSTRMSTKGGHIPISSRLSDDDAMRERVTNEKKQARCVYLLTCRTHKAGAALVML